MSALGRVISVAADAPWDLPGVASLRWRSRVA